MAAVVEAVKVVLGVVERVVAALLVGGENMKGGGGGDGDGRRCVSGNGGCYRGNGGGCFR